MMKMSDNLLVVDIQDLIDIGGTDIHNGVATANWINLALYDRVMFVVEVGPTWNAADQLDDLHVNQASDATGTGTKAIAGKNLDQTAVNSAGERFCIEVCAADCDIAGGFHWVRLECAEAGNTDIDQVRAFAICDGARYKSNNLSAFTDLA